MKEQLAEFISEEEAADIITKMELRREFMEAVFSAIDDRYGSIPAFLEQEFGLSPDKRAQLQAYCLE